MEECRYCLQVIPIGSTTCPKCGKPTHSQFNQQVPGANPNLIPCPKCGSFVSPDARACPSCGHDVGAPKRAKFWLIAFILFAVALAIGQWFNYQAHLISGR